LKINEHPVFTEAALALICRLPVDREEVTHMLNAMSVMMIAIVVMWGIWAIDILWHRG